MTHQMISASTDIRVKHGGVTAHVAVWRVRELVADRYALREFCAFHFSMELHEDIVPIAEALDRSLEVCDAE